MMAKGTVSQFWKFVGGHAYYQFSIIYYPFSILPLHLAPQLSYLN
ncbi:MAG: hypothetical protein HW419_4456 [Deltaproteobacteria bacterium]|nr:hypothetical protein [Deltaproteobacteria bacterium]